MNTVIIFIGVCFMLVGCFFFGFISGLAAGGYIKGYREGSEAERARCIKKLDEALDRLSKKGDPA